MKVLFYGCFFAVIIALMVLIALWCFYCCPLVEPAAHS